MEELQGSRTEQNLKEAYQKESGARNRYCYFAKKAKKEGYEHIARIFEETEHNERQHAKIWFKELYGDIPDTEDNLCAAAATEHEEWAAMYNRMEDEAKAEGFHEIAQKFRLAAEVEKRHESRFSSLHKAMKDDKVFEKDSEVKWQCLHCGYLHTGKEAPEECPLCGEEQEHFALKEELH